MPMFETRYFSLNAASTRKSERGTQLWARNEAHARELISRRNMGEEFVSLYIPYDIIPQLPTELLDQKKYGEAMHSACWLGMVATASGSATGFDLLSDEGPIHTLAHIVHQLEIRPGSDVRDRFVSQCYQPLLALQRATPGFDKEAAGDKLWVAQPPPTSTREDLINYYKTTTTTAMRALAQTETYRLRNLPK